MKKIQILYPSDKSTGQIHRLFQEESEMMQNYGFLTGVEPLPAAEVIIKRGFTIKATDEYPWDSRMIQGWEENRRTLDFSCYADTIKPWTIPFDIVDSISDEQIIKEIMQSRNWGKVFIKSKNSSLFAFGDDASVYPASTLESMSANYNRIGESGPYIIRKFIDCPEIFYEEQRYWVINGRVYHPSGIVPQFVKDAAHEIYQFSGSKYFTIDVAGEYIVEVNPGESSDRGGENPLDFFCGIFAKEFLKNHENY